MIEELSTLCRRPQQKKSKMHSPFFADPPKQPTNCVTKCYWASVSEPHTSVFNGEFVCAYGVHTYVRTHITAYRFAFQYTFQIDSVIFQIVHVATVAAVQLA